MAFFPSALRLSRILVWMGKERKRLGGRVIGRRPPEDTSKKGTDGQANGKKAPRITSSVRNPGPVSGRTAAIMVGVGSPRVNLPLFSFDRGLSEVQEKWHAGWFAQNLGSRRMASVRDAGSGETIMKAPPTKLIRKYRRPFE